MDSWVDTTQQQRHSNGKLSEEPKEVIIIFFFKYSSHIEYKLYKQEEWLFVNYCKQPPTRSTSNDQIDFSIP